MKESDLKKGVISKGKLRRKIRRALRPQVVKTIGSAPLVWNPIVIPNLTIKNQFQSESCGGQSASYWIEIVDKKLANNDIQFSAKSIYAPIAYPQGGTTVYALETQVGKLGANFETDVPSYHDGTTDEPFMTDKSFITPANSLKALRDAYRSAVTVDINIDAIAQAINDSGAVIIEVQGQDNGTWLSPVPAHPTKAVWAHFVCGAIYGTYNGVKVIGFPNSWGNTVGNQGWQFFTEDYINSGFIVDIFTWYPIDVITTGGQTGWLGQAFQNMLKWFLT